MFFEDGVTWGGPPGVVCGIECDGDDVIADCDEISDGEVEKIDGPSLDIFVAGSVDAVAGCVDAVETSVVMFN